MYLTLYSGCFRVFRERAVPGGRGVGPDQGAPHPTEAQTTHPGPARTQGHPHRGPPPQATGKGGSPHSAGAKSTVSSLSKEDPAVQSLSKITFE